MLLVSRDSFRSPTTLITGRLRAVNRSGWRSAFSRSLRHRGGEVGLFVVLDPVRRKWFREESSGHFRGRRVVGVSCDARDEASADRRSPRLDKRDAARRQGPETGVRPGARSAIAAVISAIASSTGTPFFCGAVAVAERDRTGGAVVLPRDEHVGHLGLARVADLLREPVVARVELDADALAPAAASSTPPRYVVELLGDRDAERPAPATATPGTHRRSARRARRRTARSSRTSPSGSSPAAGASRRTPGTRGRSAPAG